MKLIGLLLVFVGIVITFPYVKNKMIRTSGWALDALGWLLCAIVSFTTGYMLIGIIDSVLCIAGIGLFITSLKECKDGI